MVKTKGLEATIKRYEDAISTVPEKYKSGVEATNDQNEKAIAAEELWRARIQEAIATNARVRGLQRSSTQHWKEMAAKKGAERIATGMREALPKFRQGIQEVLNVIESTEIGERTADPMANVDNRVKPIVRALYDMKRRR